MFSSTIYYLKQIRKTGSTGNSVVYHLTKKEKMRLALTIFSGKIFGVIAVIILIKSLPGMFANTAFAAETFTPHEITTFNSINTVWTLVAAFLVFGMQAGFVMLEAGFARSKETVNVLLECIFDTAICGILFWAIGYAFMFSHGNGFVGTHWFFLSGAPATYETTGIPILAHWIFQFAFADTTSTITSGAMIGRTSFRGDILYSVGVTGFIYPIIGHWAWGPDGWLALMGSEGHFFPSLGQGFRDFAGSTVVHTIGGVISLAGALVLGPRIGRIFTRDDREKGGLPPAHNLPLATVGAFILWFGWYGFNPGSTLSAIDADGIGRIAANTTLAACAASLTAMILPLWLGPNKGKFDLAFTVNGLLAGLVAITCPCYWVSPLGAILIGLIAGVVVYYGTLLLEFLRIDDPVGAVPVHGIAGIWGTLSLGLFACGQYGATGPTGADNSSPVKGLFYGGGLDVLKAQFIGSAVITLSTFLIALILMWVVNKLPYPWKLRVEPEAEYGDGLDKFEHGVSAYHFQE
ncbi:ammonium transporter [Hydrotalea sp.]|uniref:ammonium transporter n=1 Tax=Hydrotalea sp. TaxID=2881279 RepID=UPI0026057F90|nr:ammonium transporter [Hydrotalea sp.]